MTFLVGEALEKAIRKVTKGAKVRCAVAFWGHRADKLFSNPRGARIICNLRAGGTNPCEIEKLKAAGVLVQQCDRLHAKVYIGGDRAIVTSANASANGLGLEGQEQASWIEAGVELDDPTAAADWFERQWKESREIKDMDIEAAKLRWAHRQRNKPSLISFSEFNADLEDPPIITWWVSSPDWEPCKESIEKQLGRYDDVLADRIDNSIEMSPDDESVLQRSGTWILFWARTSKGFPSKRSKPYWFCTGSILREAFVYIDDKSTRYDVVLPAEQPPPEPFDATDRLFRQVLYDVLKRDEYAKLRTDYTGSWFAPRQKLMRPLWQDLKERYCELVASAHGR